MLSKYKTIVIAIDSSEDGNPVLEAVSELAERDSKDYHVISVIEPLITPVSGMDPSAFAATWSLQEMEQQISEHALKSVKKRAAEHGISEDRVQILHGNPASLIRSFAEQNDADLIVIGSHARKGVARLLLGSTANAVLHGASCDVLTIRVQ
ncbi:MAG: universal stress protein [Pseudomonadales bacterium]|nr:universal stress protein [Pseudomonadales bacterium]